MTSTINYLFKKASLSPFNFDIKNCFRIANIYNLTNHVKKNYHTLFYSYKNCDVA